MNVKIYEILNSKTALDKIMESELGIATGYKLAKIAKEAAEVTTLFNDKRNSLLTEYGTEDPDKSGSFNIPTENTETFNKALTVVIQEDININISNISLEDLEGTSLTPNDIVTLDWLIKVNTED